MPRTAVTGRNVFSACCSSRSYLALNASSLFAVLSVAHLAKDNMQVLASLLLVSGIRFARAHEGHGDDRVAGETIQQYAQRHVRTIPYADTDAAQSTSCTDFVRTRCPQNTICTLEIV